LNPPKWTFGLFGRLHFGSLGGAASSHFYTCYNPLNCLSSRTCGAG